VNFFWSLNKQQISVYETSTPIGTGEYIDKELPKESLQSSKGNVITLMDLDNFKQKGFQEMHTIFQKVSNYSKLSIADDIGRLEFNVHSNFSKSSEMQTLNGEFKFSYVKSLRRK
jgi:hypothetical protein